MEEDGSRSISKKNSSHTGTEEQVQGENLSISYVGVNSDEQTDLPVDDQQDLGLLTDSSNILHLPGYLEAGTPWYKATFLIVNAALGAGLLNFPLAFHETGGIVAGNIVHLVFVAFSLGSLIILALCTSEKHCKTYQEVVKIFCGTELSTVASICIALYCFVTCITFIIIIGDQFDRAFASYVGPTFCHHWYLNRKFTMVISSLLLIFPCCLKKIDGMQLMSYVGVLAIWYLVVVVVVEMASDSYRKGVVLIYDVHFVKIFNVVPTICFGYQCHVSSVPIYSCMKKSDKAALYKASSVAVLICFVVYTIGANCGYLTFGSLVNADILLSYDAMKSYVLVAVLLLAVKSWTTYPILLFCVREAVSDLYLQLRSLEPVDVTVSEPNRRKIIATVLWIASIAVAAFTPNINIVVKLLGSLAAVFIFIFPGLCLLQLTYDQMEISGLEWSLQDSLKVAVSVIYIVLGTFTLGLAFTLGVEAIVYPAAEVSICT